MTQQAMQEQTYAPGDRLVRLDHSGPGDPRLTVISTSLLTERSGIDRRMVHVRDEAGDRFWYTAEDLANTTCKCEGRHFTSKIASAVNAFGRFWSDEHAECCAAAAVLLYAQAPEEEKARILRAMRYHRVMLQARCPELEIDPEAASDG